MKQFVLFFLVLASSITAHAQLEPFSPDNSKSVGAVSNSAGNIEDLMGVWGQVSADPPKSMKGHMDEYRSTSGGPLTGALGINSFGLQNGLVKGFGGFLLLVFTGASIFQNLQRGELNLVPLAGKLALGIVIIFHPELVYATGRVIQTSGANIAYASISAMENSAMGRAIKAADLGKLSAATIETQAAEQAKASVAGYLFNNPERARQGVQTFNSQNKAGLKIEPATKGDAQATNARAGEALNLIGLALAKDESYQSALKALREKFNSDMKAAQASGDAGLQDQLQKQFLVDASRIATETAEKLYGIGADDKLWDGTLGKITNSPKVIADWLSKAVAGFLIPIAIWILTKGAAMVMELSVIIVVCTYPFFMWEGTQKTFIGSLQTFFATALVPAVGVVLLCILEGIMAMIAKAMGGSMQAVSDNVWGRFIGAGSMQLGFAIGFLLLWVAGLCLVCWYVPKITSRLMTGGSVIGGLAGGLAMAAGAGLMGAVGLGSVALGNVGGLSTALKAGKDLAGSGKDGQKQLPATTGTGDSGSSGATGLLADSGGSSGGGTGSAFSNPAPIPQPTGKSQLGSLESDPKAASFEEKIAQKQAQERAHQNGQILGPDGQPISSEQMRKQNLADQVKGARVEIGQGGQGSGSSPAAGSTAPASSSPSATAGSSSTPATKKSLVGTSAKSADSAKNTGDGAIKTQAKARGPYSNPLTRQIMKAAGKMNSHAYNAFDDDEVTQDLRKGMRSGNTLARSVKEMAYQPKPKAIAGKVAEAQKPDISKFTKMRPA